MENPWAEAVIKICEGIGFIPSVLYITVYEEGNNFTSLAGVPTVPPPPAPVPLNNPACINFASFYSQQSMDN